MYSSLKFTQIPEDKSYSRNIDFSEVVNKNEMFISAYGGGNTVQLTLTEKQMRELRKHLTIQIRKIMK